VPEEEYISRVMKNPSSMNFVVEDEDEPGLESSCLI
jgi:hypothetical protein